MKKLFIHHPLFRLLSPLFSGTLVYLLILLFNNTLNQLYDTFLGQELYICIGLAYLIQEFARFTLVLFAASKSTISFLSKAVLLIGISISITFLLVSLVMYGYFTIVLNYSPHLSELIIFNSIFSLISLIYSILYLSHYFLHKINTDKIEKARYAREKLRDDFFEFQEDINPELLFESLESILIHMKKDTEKAEMLVDRFCKVYRYILSQKRMELVPLEEELTILQELLLLFSELPYRKVKLIAASLPNALVVPCSVLKIVELIIRSTIPSENQNLELHVNDQEDHIGIWYQPEEKLANRLEPEALRRIGKNYQYYTDQAIQLVQDPITYQIRIPKIHFHESSDH